MLSRFHYGCVKGRRSAAVGTTLRHGQLIQIKNIKKKVHPFLNFLFGELLYQVPVEQPGILRYSTEGPMTKVQFQSSFRQTNFLDIVAGTIWLHPMRSPQIDS